MADETPVQDPRQLLQDAVKGQDDEALASLAENMGGVEGFLDLTFQGMCQALDPEKAQDVVVGWEIRHGDTTHAYTLVVQGGQGVVEKRAGDDARVTLNLTLPNYIRLIAGELDGMQAFMSGVLQLKGDMIFAAQIPQMFGLGEAPGGLGGPAPASTG